MTMDCLFCKIINRDIRRHRLRRRRNMFNHQLRWRPTRIIPKRLIATLLPRNRAFRGGCPRLPPLNWPGEGLCRRRLPVVMNCNEQGGQTVHHIQYVSWPITRSLVVGVSAGNRWWRSGYWMHPQVSPHWRTRASSRRCRV
ncbi:hypothetical protein DSL92_05825 [Billgrantia gudaonensis]|uniref:Uncharacterized protein n=1 Tax=Billgrantia gudaonensis TaxID=376427 RepID=A0A3S0Q150_9GAMM|nr:hypothetical protein DSL92_05825 [Halomonas gudaonensis]